MTTSVLAGSKFHYGDDPDEATPSRLRGSLEKMSWSDVWLVHCRARNTPVPSASTHSLSLIHI